MENTSKYQTETDNNVRTSLKNEAFDEWMAYLVIRGSDQTKYGTLCHGFVSQFSLGNNQYPKTIQKATDALSQHKFDGKYYENQEKIDLLKSNTVLASTILAYGLIALNTSLISSNSTGESPLW